LALGAHPAGMFNIYFDDEDDFDSTRTPLASHADHLAAIDDLDRIAEQTRAQLKANDEGHSGYLLCLCIHDTRLGRLVGLSCEVI
jgi:hypothetical protein